MAYTDEQIQAVQGVVDRVSAYQDGAPEGTVETELRKGLGEAGVELDDAHVTALAETIEADPGNAQAADVLS